MSGAVVRVTPPIDTDPAARRGHRCVVCGAALGEIARRNKDPFCRTECCKRYYEAHPA